MASTIKAILIPVIVDMERMSIAVERATVSVRFIPAYNGIGGDVGLLAGINPIAPGTSHSIAERKPVALITDDIDVSRSLFNAYRAAEAEEQRKCE